MKNNLFEFLKSVNEEKAIIEKKPDDNYHVVYKKRLLSNDGSDVGWLYVDVSNARLNDDNVYIIELIKENKIKNREYRRGMNSDKSNKNRKNKTIAN